MTVRNRGGYRDVLVNIMVHATGHVAECQISLTPLLAIKSGGGHATYAHAHAPTRNLPPCHFRSPPTCMPMPMCFSPPALDLPRLHALRATTDPLPHACTQCGRYAIARIHDLYERSVYRHEGMLTKRLLEAVSSGIICELVCRGTSAGLTRHFDALLTALSAPACRLRELRLVDCDWPYPPPQRLQQPWNHLPPHHHHLRAPAAHNPVFEYPVRWTQGGSDAR